MLTKKKTLIRGFMILFGIGLSTITIANTCPTALKRNHHGYWYSDEKPGWKSHKTTKDGVTLRPEHFGGAIYSPHRNRIACMYKASNKEWVALASNTNHGIVIDKKAMNDSKKGPAWKYSKKYKIYACGMPSVSQITGCPFQLKK